MATRRKKPASRSRAGGRRRRAPRARSFRNGLWFALKHLLLWSALAFAAYWLWLDFRVATAFENRRWALPARVYARPLELHPGAPVSQARLLRELSRLGYRKVASARAPGEFSVAASATEFHARGFRYWDFPEPSRRVAVTFGADGIQTLADAATAAPLDLMRLDPLELARINPRSYEDRDLLAYEDLPERFLAALVAVEDRRYFNHLGIDLPGLARAMWVNLRALRFVQGGSTLTQQLVKNLYLTRERTLARKFNEMLMALSLERRYDKRDILETYVNEVFLGQDGNRAVHGFGLAAQFYFSKPLPELGLGEMATLIGMVKGPSVYNPRRNPQAARKRRNVVLATLESQGLITATEAVQLKAAPLAVSERARGGSPAYPALMGLVRRQLLRDYSAEDLNVAGLNVFTTADIELQSTAERGIQETLTALESGGARSALQAAMIVAEPTSGEILALVGDRNADFDGFNRALDAKRPVGSVIKPFVYARALEQPRRFSLMSRIEDTAVELHDASGEAWRPKNFDGIEHGEVTLLQALVRSFNLATVNLGMAVGLGDVAAYLERLGAGDALPEYPSLLLGALDLSPFEVTELYTVIANDGFRVPLRAILAVTDPSQRKLKRYGLQQRAVMEPAAAAMVRYAMTQVVEQGTGRALQTLMGDVLPLAGKTGTSNGNRDSWFAGFGSNRLAVAWVGRDDNAPAGLTGSSGALRVWAHVMRSAGIAPLSLTLPAEVEWRRANPAIAALISEDCSQGIMIPVHRQSSIPVAATCDGREARVPDSPGLFDRIRGLFR